MKKIRALEISGQTSSLKWEGVTRIEWNEGKVP